MTAREIEAKALKEKLIATGKLQASESEEEEIECASGEEGISDDSEEGEVEWEEGESIVEFSGDSDDASESDSQESDAPPKLVPITKTETKTVTKTKTTLAPYQLTGKKRKRVPDSEESSDIDTDELEEEEDEMGMRGNNGFVYSGDIDTYKMKKNERIAAQNAAYDHTEHREQFKREFAANKGGGSSNLAKLKNKPFNMVLPKKANAMRDKRDDKIHKKKKLTQLGSYNKRTKDKIESKKRRQK